MPTNQPTKLSSYHHLPVVWIDNKLNAYIWSIRDYILNTSVLFCLTVNCQSVLDVALWRYTSVVSSEYSKGSLLVLRKHLFESISAIIFSNNEYFTVERAQLWRLTSNRWQEFNLSLNAFVGTTEVYIILTNFRQHYKRQRIDRTLPGSLPRRNLWNTSPK
jgi:hypothetical protein